MARVVVGAFGTGHARFMHGVRCVNKQKPLTRKPLVNYSEQTEDTGRDDADQTAYRQRLGNKNLEDEMRLCSEIRLNRKVGQMIRLYS